MAKIKLSEKKIQELKDVCKTFNNDKGELINVLHKAQGLFGYLPAEVQEVIARRVARLGLNYQNDLYNPNADGFLSTVVESITRLALFNTLISKPFAERCF